MNVEEDIKNSIETFVRRHLPPLQVRDAVVLDVDWSSRTCHVQLNDKTELWNVRLRAAISDPAETSGFCCKPKVNSQVLIGMVEGLKDNAFVCMFTDIDAIEMIYGSTSILTADLTNGQITFNGGNKGGVPIIQALYDAINRLETKLTAHQHTYVTPGGPATTTTAGTQEITPLTTKANLEDTKVKH